MAGVSYYCGNRAGWVTADEIVEQAVEQPGI